MQENTADKELNRIEKRAIEALAIAPVIKAVSERIGRDEALAILKEVNEQEAFQRGRDMAEKIGQNDIEALVDEVVQAFRAVLGYRVLDQVLHVPAKGDRACRFRARDLPPRRSGA